MSARAAGGGGLGSTPSRPPRTLVGAVALGTLLNPLNSSMIAVALLRLRAEFAVSVATATWLISGFYLAAAIGQPLMGRLADLFGPRRVFCAGLMVVCLATVPAPWAPSFGWLVAIRVVQAFGTSAAFPAGLSMFRASQPNPSAAPPAGALGVLSITANVSAALGPTLGGILVVAAGWPAIFLVNAPITLVGLAAALRWMPPDGTRAHARTVRSLVRDVDLPGILLFSGTLVSLLAFLLSLSGNALWALLAVCPVAAAALYVRERRASSPFFNVSMLAANRGLVGVYAQFAGVNVVFYAIFFGLATWLEGARGFGPGSVGVLLLPLSGLAIAATPVAARLVRRSGHRRAVLVGTGALAAGTLLLLLFGPATPLPLILGVIGVLGVANGFNNLGLQAALYDAAPAGGTGAAAGLFQTFRYVGSILSTSVLGLTFGNAVTSGGLRATALVIAALSLVLWAVSLLRSTSAR